jgi:hypothetical protein
MSDCLFNYKVFNVNVLAKRRVQLACMYIYINRERIVMEIAATALIRGVETEYCNRRVVRLLAVSDWLVVEYLELRSRVRHF